MRSSRTDFRNTCTGTVTVIWTTRFGPRVLFTVGRLVGYRLKLDFSCTFALTIGGAITAKKGEGLSFGARRLLFLIVMTLGPLGHRSDITLQLRLLQ